MEHIIASLEEEKVRSSEITQLAPFEIKHFDELKKRVWPTKDPEEKILYRDHIEGLKLMKGLYKPNKRQICGD